ncbi:PP2C family protein-serine/threonine phosphatase [Anaerostipes sp.]|uniref:PP2C family protein-serine/threonine phosphatase n=1 Tax=Anaerostipes sp. TaxID=1872530 RepID=UPI0025C4854D|nr:protein phosphatase 2C domain-containing protein [Anaerostipes sp.]MBS7008434.1 serine/threonine-protein phosphatase [Anaerostipes sp.]
MFGRKKKKKNQKVGKTIEIPRESQKPVLVKFPGLEAEFRFGNAQHIGARSRQEDSFGFSDLSDKQLLARAGICAVLADGMGGLSSGRDVSELAVSRTLEFFKQIQGQLPVWQQMKGFISKLSDEIFSMYGRDGKAGAGATLAAAIFYENRLYWCTAGDSRLYLFRGGRLYQLNEDHNYKNRLLGRFIRGEASFEEAMRHPQKDALTSYLGCPVMEEIDANHHGFILQNKDKILMVTDGIYNTLTEEEMAESMRREPQEACGRMVNTAALKQLPGQDNMTAMAVSYN